MEENNINSDLENNGGSKLQFDLKNLKPFLSVFIILVIIIFGYYFFWRSITIKIKNIVVERMGSYQYDSIKISGFPFSKVITINNLTIANNDTPLVTNNQVNIKEVKISSFILSGSADVKLKDVSIITVSDNKVYSLMYNEEPVFNVGFYSNGSLKNLKYVDNGYRVVSSNNETLYTADKSDINITSLTNANTIDYSIIGVLQNIKNFSVIENTNGITINDNPDVYSLNFDLSSSITKNNGATENSILKINSFNIDGSKNKFSLDGEVFKDNTDQYSYGDITAVLTNYPELLEYYRTSALDSMDSSLSTMSDAEKTIYSNILNQFFNELLLVLKKNSKTTETVGVLNIKRNKGDLDYIVNGESLTAIIQKILLSSSMQQK